VRTGGIPPPSRERIEVGVAGTASSPSPGLSLRGRGVSQPRPPYPPRTNTPRAIEYYEQQLTITREIGDRRNEGIALWNTGLALDELGKRTDAVASAEAALQVLEEVEDPITGIVRKKLADWRGMLR
jgi:tetratricopeptide (TPR) repeat protein